MSPHPSVGQNLATKGTRLPSGMPSLIILPPRLVAAYFLEEIQRLIKEKVAKAIQATKRKQLGFPSPNKNLQSLLSQNILNTKFQSTMCVATSLPRISNACCFLELSLGLPLTGFTRWILALSSASSNCKSILSKDSRRPDE
ncbi:hypothetical protein CRG98_040910 [Punica granatum]|uniref:Uncharacterized protein n=1 Tax=Punica granatum TaxID=22663 RepID=A0A2I0I410_PUNGR|nr:hypothetical protein CRG98_040910 [Punica granatum]